MCRAKLEVSVTKTYFSYFAMLAVSKINHLFYTVSFAFRYFIIFNQVSPEASTVSTVADRLTSVFPQSLLYKWVMRVGGQLAVHGCQNSARGAADLLNLPFYSTVRACVCGSGQMEADDLRR